jgi:hypothetical protein
MFKKAAKKTENIINSFLLLAMMFLAVNSAYGVYVSNWNDFSDAYSSGGGGG